MSGRDLSRATRGNRLQHLLENEDEVEDDFWAQGGEVANYFAEEEADQSYDSDADEEELGEESADSDIDEPEEVNEAEDEENAAKADKEADRANRKKRKSVYVDPAKLPTSKRRAQQEEGAGAEDGESGTGTAGEGEAVDEATSAAEASTPKRKGRRPKPQGGETQAEAPSEGGEGATSSTSTPARPTLRKSTVAYSQMREAERARENAEAEKRKKPKAPKIVRRYTQEELLEEAKKTAIENKKSLAELIKYEEELKKVPTTQPKIVGPMIRTVYRDGQTFVTWTDERTMPDLFFDERPPYPAKMICEVTGERAKYRDPKTGKAFASSSAFRALRERHEVNERKKLYGLDDESRAKEAAARAQQQLQQQFQQQGDSMDVDVQYQPQQQYPPGMLPPQPPYPYGMVPPGFLPMGGPGGQPVPAGSLYLMPISGQQLPSMPMMAPYGGPVPFPPKSPIGTFHAEMAPQSGTPMAYQPLPDGSGPTGGADTARPKRKYSAITPQEAL